MAMIGTVLASGLSKARMAWAVSYPSMMGMRRSIMMAANSPGAEAEKAVRP